MKLRQWWSGKAPFRMLGLAIFGLAGCDLEAGGPFGPDDRSAPRAVAAEYRWVEDGWDGTRPEGHPEVRVTWELPADFRDEVFRVYSRPSGSGGYTLVGTVTSCSGSECVYADRNVRSGRSYDYYVAAVDERRDEEAGSSAVRVTVPEYGVPPTPTIAGATSLDGAVYLRWESTGAERYRVFVERIDGETVFYEIGATDGLSFVDTRARNGRRYAYRIAGVDTLGHVSVRSALAVGVPRPDYHTDLLYSLASNPDSSGFRFVTSQAESPIVAGSATGAQWRLESIDGVLSIVPRGTTTVTRGQFTTALTCGPGSEPDCRSVTLAPAATAFSSAPASVQAGHTYVFRVTGADGRPHFGKVRVQGQSTDGQGRSLIIYDWAYQLLPDEPSLSRIGS